MGLDMFLIGIDENLNVNELAYWRKANAVHNWFVENVQKGEDDCGRYIVEEDDLRELQKVCKQVLDNKNNADGILPTVSGFFFGSTDYDEWYYNDIQFTYDKITEILESDVEYIVIWYQSSW